MYTKKNSNLDLLSSQCFIKALYLEKRRSERSGRGFAVVLLELRDAAKSDRQQLLLRGAISVLSRSTRDTDLRGWYVDGSVIGILFTEFGPLSAQTAVDILTAKITTELMAGLTAEQMAQISLSSYVHSERPVPSVIEVFTGNADEVPVLSSVASADAIQLIENNAETNVLN